MTQLNFCKLSVILPYKNFTWNFTYENNISCVTCFNSMCEMCNFEAVHFTCELGISYVKTFLFNV